MATQQRALTVLLPLESGKTEEARWMLRQIAPNIVDQFRHSRSTHFARFVIVEDRPRRKYRDRLLFTSNYDGSEESYLSELTKSCGEGLDKIFQYCEGYDAGVAMTAELKTFLSPFMKKPKLFFVSLPGLTAEAIQTAGEVRKDTEEKIDRQGLEEVRRMRERSAELRPKRKRRSPGLKKSSELGERFKNRIAGISVEGTNPNTIVPRRPDLERVEDRGIQNSLTVIGPVKKSKIRRLVLRGYLLLGRVFARRSWGALSGVTSIHFARWLIVDGGDTLIFESNYDGSWDSYIDNFVDVTSAGLNVIWNSCVGYPSLGCKDLESFKAVIREHQAEDLIFYSAYPDLTVKDIIASNAFDLTAPSHVGLDDVKSVIAGSYEIND